MKNHIADMSPRKAAKIAGVVYLICIVLGIFANIFVRQSLIVPGDAAATVNNIMANEMLFRIGFVADLLFLAFWLLLPLALYKLLKPVNNIHALLLVVFALVMVPIMFINNVFQFAALSLLSGADYLAVFETGQLHALAMFFLDLRETGFLMPSIFYGLWLLPFGYLVYNWLFSLQIGHNSQNCGCLVDTWRFGLSDRFSYNLSSSRPRCGVYPSGYEYRGIFKPLLAFVFCR